MCVCAWEREKPIAGSAIDMRYLIVEEPFSITFFLLSDCYQRVCLIVGEFFYLFLDLSQVPSVKCSQWFLDLFKSSS